MRSEREGAPPEGDGDWRPSPGEAPTPAQEQSRRPGQTPHDLGQPPGRPPTSAPAHEPEAPPGQRAAPGYGQEPPAEPPQAAVQRLHPAAIGVAAVEALRESAVPLLVIAALAVFGGGDLDAQALLRLVGYGAIATVIAIVFGYVRWASTSYWLEDDAVHLRRGVFQRQQAAVPVERISSIDTVEGPVHRLLGVTQLEVHAAGGGQEPEISLLALSPEAAAAVRAHAARSGAGAVADEASSNAPVRVLSRRALLVAALTSGQFTVLLPVLAALSQILDDVIGRTGGEEFERYLPPESVGDALVALAVLLAAAWALSILGTIVAFAGFTVVRDGDRLRMTRGLVQRRVSTVPVARVQAIRVVEGVLRQPFGLASVRVESAGYAGQPSANTTLFPLLPTREVLPCVRAAVPELAAPLEPLQRPPRRASALYVGVPVALAAVAAAVLALVVSPAFLLLPLGAAGVGHLQQRAAGWRLEHGFLVARSRRMARTTVVAAGRRLAERTFAQGPLARRLGLATLAFALASRTRWDVAHIEAGNVRALLGDLRPPGGA